MQCEGLFLNPEEDEYVDYTEGFTTEGEGDRERHVFFTDCPPRLQLAASRQRGDTETSTGVTAPDHFDP